MEETVTRMLLVTVFDTPRYIITRAGRAGTPRDRLLDPRQTHLLARAAKPALATGKDVEGVEKVVAREVGPEHIGEIELGVGRLDEQEIAETLLAARADHEIDVGQRVRGEMTTERADVDVLRKEQARAGARGDRAHGV